MRGSARTAATVTPFFSGQSRDGPTGDGVGRALPRSVDGGASSRRSPAGVGCPAAYATPPAPSAATATAAAEDQSFHLGGSSGSPSTRLAHSSSRSRENDRKADRKSGESAGRPARAIAPLPWSACDYWWWRTRKAWSARCAPDSAGPATPWTRRRPAPRRCEKLATTPYDLAILDITLPDTSGLDLCRAVRRGEIEVASGRELRVLMLTARASLADRVRGLDEGADDYLTKPFALVELLARIRALLRRDVTNGTHAAARRRPRAGHRPPSRRPVRPANCR